MLTSIEQFQSFNIWQIPFFWIKIKKKNFSELTKKESRIELRFVHY